MALSATAALCAFTLLVQQDAAAPILATIVGKVEPKLQLAQWTPAVAAELKSSLPDEVTKDMNFSVPPCDNFYEFACGHWIQNVEIPGSRGSYTKSWDGAAQSVHEAMISIYNTTYPPDSPYRGLNDWFTSCMNLDYIQSLGSTPIQPLLDQIAAMETKEDLMALIQHFVLYDIPSVLALDVAVGVRSQDRHVLFISGAGIVLPDESYYEIEYNGTKLGDDRAQDREYLRSYYVKINQLAGSTKDEAEVLANKTLEVETRIAQWRADEPAIDDPKGPPLSNLSFLEEQSPNVPWRAIFSQMSKECAEQGFDCANSVLRDDNNMIYGDVHFFSKLSDMLSTEPVQIWAPFLRTHAIYNLGPLLNKEFLLASLELDRLMSDISELPSRERKCVRATTHGLSALSDLRFLEVYFGPKAKADGWAILKRLKKTFIKNLHSVKWMDEDTKQRALTKANLMELNLGAPKNYTYVPYPVSRLSYFNNSALAYHTKLLRMMIELDRPLNSETWNMRASTVNAYYDNGLNALFIPAGIMQPPFFSDQYPMSQNFGAIGAIMGHEMTHGFDNTGSQFNEKRQLEEWWSKKAQKEFKKRTKCIEDLYDHFKIADTQVEGDTTLGENIADFGGVKIAYQAFLEWYNETAGGEPPDGEKRLFWVSYGQNWCDKERYKAQKLNLGFDSHSPNPFRTNGVVSQNEAFGEIFECKPGAPMAPMHKCVLWHDTNAVEILSVLPQPSEEKERQRRQERTLLKHFSISPRP